MHEYSRPLGDAIKRSRGKLGLTQSEVADKVDIDVHTVLNIENYKGNPIAIFKKVNNKWKRQTNVGNPSAKQKLSPYEPQQGAGPNFGLSIHEGGLSSWSTSFQWDSDRDYRAEDTVLSSPFPPRAPGQPLHGESAYCPSQQCLRA
jgi:DNA-binding XRE family transcriptional regulator